MKDKKIIKKIMLLSGVFMASGALWWLCPQVEQEIRAELNLPVRIEEVYEVIEEERKYERLDYLKELVDQNYESNIYLRFPDIYSEDDSNLINIDVDNNYYSITEDGKETVFETKQEILKYLKQVGLL